MDRKLHRPEEEEKHRPSELKDGPYSKEALNKLDMDNDDLNSETESVEEDIEDRNDTAGGVGGWGGS